MTLPLPYVVSGPSSEMPRTNLKAVKWGELLEQFTPPNEDAWLEAHRRVLLIARGQSSFLRFQCESEEDITAKVLLKFHDTNGAVCKALKQLENPRVQQRYIVVLVQNTIMDCVRKRARENRSLACLARRLSQSSWMKEIESRDFVAWLLSDLAGPEVELCEKLYREHLTLAQVAEQMELSYSAVAVRLHRILEKIRRRFDKCWKGQTPA